MSFEIAVRSARRAAALALLALPAACGGDLTLPDDDGGITPGTAAITVEAGDGQDGVVGEELGVPLAVRVTSDGEPLAGQGVVFEAVDGDGSLAPDTTVTNASGRATARWTLGTVPGSQSASAKLIAGGKLVRFTAVAAVGNPATLTLVSGDGQSGEPFLPLAAPLVVAVTDRFGNPVEGVDVEWEVTAGRGELTAEEVATGSDGRAQVVWTLGFSLGTQSVEASVGGLEGSPVAFSAAIF